ncbi:hypothetical protein [Gimesia sp.]|uniref:hypothetical protein n=1 Tax=Gimesia sp. TaxID=2024833 RepID=UPI003A952367
MVIGLIIGFQLRYIAFASSLLLFTFALTMTFATSPEGPLSLSVWTASTAALLLATHPPLQRKAAA